MGKVSRYMKVSTDLWQRHEFGVASVTVPVCAGGQNNWLREEHAFKILFAGERREESVLNKTSEVWV